MKKVLLPASLHELWDALDQEPAPGIYAGGTDLLVKMRSGLVNPHAIVCLERIEDLKGVDDYGEMIRIGSCATHSRLLADNTVQNHLGVLAQALDMLGSPLIRNMGTIGGNICAASPAGDTLPPLYVLGAEVELRSRNRTRRTPIENFITGPGRTCLEEREILSAVWVKKPEVRTLHHFEKVGRRNALACSMVSLAALLHVSPEGVVEKAALAWGSVGPTVVTCPTVEAALLGERLTPARLQKAAAIARQAVAPISDQRADEEYRRTVSGNLLLRLIELRRP